MTTPLAMDDPRDDEALLRDGDHARLLARYRHAITQRVRLKVPERDADDVVSEIVLYLFRELTGGKTYDAPFGAVVARRTSWTIAEYYRRPAPVPDDPPDERLGSVGPRDVSDYDFVRRLLAELPAGDAEVAKLHFVLGFDAGEVAGRLGMTANAVHQAIFRARRRLKELLDG